MSQLGHSGNSQYMGLENYDQGVCGICAVLYAVYMDRRDLRSPLAEKLGIGASPREFIQYEIYGLLASYPELHKEIQAFTQKFTKYEEFSIDYYMSALPSKKTSGDYSIALPIVAIVQYLKTWNIDATVNMSPQSSALPDRCILGLERSGLGLRHYVYKKGEKIFSYGMKFNNFESFSRTRDYTLCCSIEWNSQPVGDISEQ